MESIERIPVSLAGYGKQDSTPQTELEYINSIRNYYGLLKSPYESSQRLISQKMQAQSEQLRHCRSEILLHGRERRKVLGLRERERVFQSEIEEMESGLSWASSKISDLDLEMELKLKLIAERYDTAGRFESINGEMTGHAAGVGSHNQAAMNF